MKHVLRALLIGGLLCGSSHARDCELETLLHPQTFVRKAGKPVSQHLQFSGAGFSAPFVFHARSGDAVGARPVLSAKIWLNGRQILGPSDFRRKARTLRRSVKLQAVNHLAVRLTGTPGSELTVWIDAAGLRISPDMTGMVTALVTPQDGGLLETQGEDGSLFQLVVPPYAVRAPTQLTLAPVEQVSGLTLLGGVSAAAQIGPDGLTLMSPATLSVIPAGGIPEHCAALLCRDDGTECHLYPAHIGSSSVDLHLLHFTTAMVGEFDCAEFMQHEPTSAGSPEARALQRLAWLASVYALCQEQPGGLDAVRDAAVAVFTEWYYGTEGVRDQLDAAELAAGDEYFDVAAQAFHTWVTWLTLFPQMVEDIDLEGALFEDAIPCGWRQGSWCDSLEDTRVQGADHVWEVLSESVRVADARCVDGDDSETMEWIWRGCVLVGSEMAYVYEDRSVDSLMALKACGLHRLELEEPAFHVRVGEARQVRLKAYDRNDRAVSGFLQSSDYQLTWSVTATHPVPIDIEGGGPQVYVRGLGLGAATVAATVSFRSGCVDWVGKAEVTAGDPMADIVLIVNTSRWNGGAICGGMRGPGLKGGAEEIWETLDREFDAYRLLVLTYDGPPESLEVPPPEFLPGETECDGFPTVPYRHLGYGWIPDRPGDMERQDVLDAMSQLGVSTRSPEWPYSGGSLYSAISTALKLDSWREASNVQRVIIVMGATPSFWAPLPPLNEWYSMSDPVDDSETLNPNEWDIKEKVIKEQVDLHLVSTATNRFWRETEKCFRSLAEATHGTFYPSPPILDGSSGNEYRTLIQILKDIAR